MASGPGIRADDLVVRHLAAGDGPGLADRLLSQAVAAESVGAQVEAALRCPCHVARNLGSQVDGSRVMDVSRVDGIDPEGGERCPVGRVIVDGHDHVVCLQELLGHVGLEVRRRVVLVVGLHQQRPIGHADPVEVCLGRRALGLQPGGQHEQRARLRKHEIDDALDWPIASQQRAVDVGDHCRGAASNALLSRMHHCTSYRLGGLIGSRVDRACSCVDGTPVCSMLGRPRALRTEAGSKPQ